MRDDSELMQVLIDESYRIITQTLTPPYQTAMGLSEDEIPCIFAEISLTYALDDLSALVNKDPAAVSCMETFEVYNSFHAVLGYRIANYIYKWKDIECKLREKVARIIAEGVKKETGIDIHPGATIGPRFVIDHGVNTVIGGTSEIGSDFCIIGDEFYVLQGVILGARDVVNNHPGKRHPTIGDRVTICGCTRVFGPVNIGDDVFISPCSVITDDIPSSHKVIVINQLQLLKRNKSVSNSKPTKSASVPQKIRVYGVVPKNCDVIIIYGSNFRNCELKLVDYRMNLIRDILIKIIFKNESCIKAQLSLSENYDRDELLTNIEGISVKLECDYYSLYITKSVGLSHIIDSLVWG